MCSKSPLGMCQEERDQLWVFVYEHSNTEIPVSFLSTLLSCSCKFSGWYPGADKRLIATKGAGKYDKESSSFSAACVTSVLWLLVPRRFHLSAVHLPLSIMIFHNFQQDMELLKFQLRTSVRWRSFEYHTTGPPLISLNLHTLMQWKESTPTQSDLSLTKFPRAAAIEYHIFGILHLKLEKSVSVFRFYFFIFKLLILV